MTSYKELLAQREELEKQIQNARKEELSNAVSQARKLVAEYGLTSEDIFPSAKSSKRIGNTSKVEPKYKNPETGETWTGRGKAPKWIADQDREKYLIK